MVKYAARAIPWVRVVLAAVLVVVLMELVRWHPWVLWPLEGTAVGVLAGASACCFDEAAAVVVDVAPRSLAWRTAARMPALLALTVVWSAVVWHAGDGTLFGRSGRILVEGLVVLALGAGYATWRRAWGEPMPGLVLATTMVPLTSAWALVRPFEATLPAFPYGADSASEWAARAPSGGAPSGQSPWSSSWRRSLTLRGGRSDAGPWLGPRIPSSGGPGPPDVVGTPGGSVPW